MICDDGEFKMRSSDLIDILDPVMVGLQAIGALDGSKTEFVNSSTPSKPGISPVFSVSG